MAMAESDWFPIVVEFMSVASMVALEGTCHGMVAGHVASPLERVVRRMMVDRVGMGGGWGMGGWCVTWSRWMMVARVQVGQAKAAEGRGMVAGASCYSLVVSSGGNVHSFGDGAYGQLGHGVESIELVPRRIEALDRVQVVSVAAGDTHSMALTVGGDVYTWGDGGNGQLGHGDWNITCLVPTKVDALQDMSGIACGEDHSMAVRRDAGSHHILCPSHCKCTPSLASYIWSAAMALEHCASANPCNLVDRTGRCNLFIYDLI